MLNALQGKKTCVGEFFFLNDSNEMFRLCNDFTVSVKSFIG